MSRLRTSFVLGYHGCEREIGEKILAGEDFKPSDKDFDWLGPGAYFWESDPDRADEWARSRKDSRALKEPFVVGAVIDLRNCLDLTTQGGVVALQSSFDSLQAGRTKAKLALPVNEDLKLDPNKDKLMRRLDNAVIRHLHQNVEEEHEKWLAGGQHGQAPPEPFDTVRGLFPEGGEAFKGAGVLARTHTQVAVRNSQCIVGVFRRRGP